MPIKKIQNLLNSNFNALDYIRKLILKPRNTTQNFINQLNESNERLSWYKKHLELHRKHNSNMPNYINNYEVFECEFGQNIQQEINKRRPCVVLKTYSSVAVVVPIMHKKMIKFDSTNWTLHLPNENGGTKSKKVPDFTFPVEQDFSFRAGSNPNWVPKKLNGCIELGHIRVVSKIRLSKMPIGRISSSNITEINRRLFNFLNINITDLTDYNNLKNLNTTLQQKIDELTNEKNKLTKTIIKLSNEYQEIYDELSSYKLDKK